VTIHPQSLVHSLVEFTAASVLAQLSHPDTRVPIAHALGFPNRIDSGVPALDLVKLGRLSFEAPDLQRFPCLTLACDAARTGGSAPAVLNAANEIAVAAFLARRLNFDGIAAVIESVLQQHATGAITSLDDALAADAWARERAQAALTTRQAAGA
jgi:1-deoxy-D-xylulose-5-phosphate reductoisomerase